MTRTFHLNFISGVWLSLGLLMSISTAVGATSTSAAVAGLSFISAPQSVTSGVCSGVVTVGVVNSSGSFVKATGSVVITAKGSGAMIYRDSACKTVAQPVQIPAGGASTSFYFSSNTAGPLSIMVTAAKLGTGVTPTPASQSESVASSLPSSPPPPSQSGGGSGSTAVAGLGFISAPQSVIPGVCSGVVTVGVVNSSGNFVKATGGVVIAATGSGATIYRDNTCKTATQPAQISAGGTSTSFYFLSSNVGSLPITVTAAKLGTGVVPTPAVQNEAIVAGTVTVNELSPASLSASVGQNFHYTYSFSAEPLGANDTIEANFVNSAGKTIFQDSFQPASGTAEWSGAVSITRFVSVPPLTVAGEYSIVLSIVNSSSVPIPLAMGKGVKAASGTDAYQVGTVAIAASNVVPDPSATIPPQAVSAGYVNPVFSDNFSSANTISPDGTGNYNWYTTNFFTASATLPASGYSVQDGYLTINTDASGYSDGLATADPSNTSQAWQHAYFEASARFNPVNPGGAPGNGTAWPAFWSWSVEDALGYDKVGATRGPYAELDFFEAYPTGGQGSGIDLITTIHQWVNNAQKQNSNNVPKIPAGTDYTQFHTYGCLWTPNKVVWYFDNQPVTTVPTGPGTTFTAIEQAHMALILGTGANWPMDVKFVHVWQ